MTVATYLLFVLGCLGATDIALYHSLSHGIRHHPDSRSELVTHSLRGPTYAALFLLVPNFVMQGAWFWAFMGLLAFDLAISIWDFSIEGESRRFLGGLPPGEYVLHVLLAMVFGAMVAAVLFEAGAWATRPTRFAYDPVGVPVALRVLLAVMAVLVLVSGVQDALAVLRLHHLPRRGAQQG